MTSHNPNAINKLNFDNVIAISGNNAINFKFADPLLVSYLAKRPNFDILKLLFSNKIILVEGPSEEMLINTIFSNDTSNLNSIDVLSIGHKGFKMFLEIWLLLNKGNLNKKIGIIRDFDNQPKAKDDHDIYETENPNIFVRTTTEYTLEDEIVTNENNRNNLSKLFGVANNSNSISEYMKSCKTESILTVCNAWQLNKDLIIPPKHISEIIDLVK